MKHSRVFALVAALLLAVSAHAVTYDVTIAFDTDRKTSTGCTFTTPAGTFAGAEQLVVTHVSVVGGVATTTGVTRQACVGGSFAGAVPVDTHSWPAGLTSSGNLFIETHVNPTDISNSTVTPMRMAYFVTDGTHNDGVMANPAGGALLFPDASRRRVVGPGPPARTITLDRADADWSGTSPDHVTFTAGTFGTFTVTTTPAHPTAAITFTGSFPSGVSFHDNGDGTATISGTPSFGGVSAVLLKATNVVGSATQNFTLTVSQPPAFTTPNATTFTAGSNGTFTVAASGFPLPALSLSGALPGGVSFGDNGNGTGQ